VKGFGQAAVRGFKQEFFKFPLRIFWVAKIALIVLLVLAIPSPFLFTSAEAGSPFRA